MRIALVTAGTAVVLSGALAGCSFSAGSSNLNTQQVEDLIVGNLEKDAPNLSVTADCPTDVTVQSGATFECTATIENGGNVKYTVTQSDDQGNVQAEPQSAILPVATVEQEITTGLTQQVQGNWAVNCGDGTQQVLIEAPGATFECEASDGSQLVAVAVTVTDTEGKFSWETKE